MDTDGWSGIVTVTVQSVIYELNEFTTVNRKMIKEFLLRKYLLLHESEFF